MNTDVVVELQKLKLSDYPVNEIKRIIHKTGHVAIMITDYHEFKDIERAVNNTKDEPEFSLVARISYKPAEYNQTFLRASTPNTTMFYGVVISEYFKEAEKRYARVIGISEISALIRSREILEGQSRITFGKWEVTSNISLATIIDPTKEYTQPYLNELKDKYLRFIAKEPVEVQKESIKYMKYFSEEFSKEVGACQNHDYLISALLTEFLVAKGFDGVVYPSVRSQGYGLCVAIHPRVMNHLKLTRVLQCKIIKTPGQPDDRISLLNEKNCLVKDGATEFKLLEI
jgi:hypothetical protein